MRITKIIVSYGISVAILNFRNRSLTLFSSSFRTDRYFESVRLFYPFA